MIASQRTPTKYSFDMKSRNSVWSRRNVHPWNVAFIWKVENLYDRVATYTHQIKFWYEKSKFSMIASQRTPTKYSFDMKSRNSVWSRRNVHPWNVAFIWKVENLYDRVATYTHQIKFWFLKDVSFQDISFQEYLFKIYWKDISYFM